MSFDNISSILDFNNFKGLLNLLSYNEGKDIKLGYTIMIDVLSTGTLEKIILFFQKKPHMLEYINLYFEIKLYPIHYIFKNKNIDKNLIDLLIYYKAKLKYTNEEISIINILFNNKSLNKKKVFEILKYLKENNYDFNNCGNNMNIFHYLGESNYVDNDILNLFNDCNINNKNNNEETPLLNSIRHDNSIVTEYLLNRENCDIEILNNNNNTPLMYAAMNNNIKIISLLIKRGCNVNYKDNQGDVALFYACGCDNKGIPQLNIIKYLVVNGCAIDSVSVSGQTALHYASGCESVYSMETIKPNLNIVYYLIQVGVDLNKLDNNNYTFIDYLLDFYNINYLYENLLKNINLGTEIMNSLIINNMNLKKLVIKKVPVQNNDEIICGISRCSIEKNDYYFKCKFNHYFEKNLLLKWYKKSSKYSCPLCFGIIDLSKEYKKI